MNKKVYLIALTFAAGLFFTACNKEETPAKPVINILELGEGDSHGNNHTAKIGGELHIEAEITAEGKIDKVSIRLHPESFHSLKDGLEGWELDTTFIGFSGLKNTLFHEHLEIDSSASPGNYHFDFVVTDMEGNQGSAAADVVIEE